MDPATQYMAGQMRPGHPALLAAYQRESIAAIAACNPLLDIPYGPELRAVFDFFRSPKPWRGTMAYFHAGYWQSRDKAQFRFLAPAFLAAGIDVAMVNYPLCPDVTLHDLLDIARGAIPVVLAHAGSLRRGGAHVVAAGHSAGGHIAVELALTGWPSGTAPISGVAALSGVYDLEPLLATASNDKLQLNPVSARALSPLHRVRGGMPPALFAVGAAETPAFVAQNAAMHRAWADAGNPARVLEVPGADHFTLLRGLQAHAALFAHVLELF